MKDTNTLQDEFMEFWDSKKEILGLGDYSDVVLHFFINKFNQKLEEEREKIVNEIMNHKFNTIDAETALMSGNFKLSTINKKVVIDSKELIDVLQIIKNKKI